MHEIVNEKTIFRDHGRPRRSLEWAHFLVWGPRPNNFAKYKYFWTGPSLFDSNIIELLFLCLNIYSVSKNFYLSSSLFHKCTSHFFLFQLSNDKYFFHFFQGNFTDTNGNGYLISAEIFPTFW